jgi:hypothetical protein
MRQVRPTTAPELLLIAYRALSPSEQERAFQLIHEARVQRLAGEDSETGQMLRCLRRVTELLGEVPGMDEYKRVQKALAAEGEHLEPVSRVYKHFGSWHLAKEAVGFSETTTARKIDARFASRKLGKVWRYTDATLRDALSRCVNELGHVPQVAEFDHWRQRELELAQARGEDPHLPSATPYRRRWGTWEKALLSFGYSQAEIDGRLERD